jgi:hypothetical protein
MISTSPSIGMSWRQKASSLPLHAGRERQHGGGLDARVPGLGQAADQLGARRVLGVVQPHRDEHEQALADVLERHERQGRHVVLERGVPAHVARQGGHDAGVLAQRRGRLLRLVDRDPDAHHRAEFVGTEGEPGDDAEVAAAAAQRPEELGVGFGIDLDDLAAGQDELERDEVVAGETVLAGEPADPAAERQAGHPRLGHDPGRDDQPVRRGRGVDVAEPAAAARVHQPGLRIDGDLAQPGQVDGQAAVRHGLARHIVAAAADRRRQAVLAGHADRRDHVLGADAAQDQAGAPVDHGVPDQPDPLVVRVVRADDVALERAGELLGDAQSQLLVNCRRCRRRRREGG